MRTRDRARSRRRARHVALVLIGAAGLIDVILAVLAADWGSWLAELAALWVFILWVRALIRFDADTAGWGSW